MQRSIPVVCLFIVLAACGGGGASTPTGPAATAPVINGSTDLVFIGQTVTFSASGGNVTWGGDAPQVANIDANTGVVTGITNGKVTIWAENAAGRTTRLVRVLPSYNGTWSGSYALLGCQSTGDFARGGFCGSFFQGQILNISFAISQSRDNVTGTFALGSLQGSLNAGVVNDDGSLPLSGTIASGNNTVQLQNLRLTSRDAGTLKGSFDQVWGATTLAGTGRLSCDIRDVTRTSGAPIVADSNTTVYSLEELIRGALRRF